MARATSAKPSVPATHCAARLLASALARGTRGAGTAPADDVRSTLDDARVQGKRLLRLIAPTRVVGLSITTTTLVLFVLLSRTDFAGIPVLIGAPTSLTLLVSVLSTERKVIYLLTSSFVVTRLVIIVLFAMLLYARARAYAASGCRALGDATVSSPECLQRSMRILSAAAFLLSSTLSCVSVIATARLPARLILLRLWRTWGALQLLDCASNTTLAVFDVAIGGWHSDVPQLLQVCNAVMQLVVGMLASRADFRLRAQVWLASRGEAVTTAASIAALIGSRPVEEVQRVALQRLRCIDLGLVTIDALTSPTPDPLLFGRTVRCQLGQIDAFVSHRCACARARRSRAEARQARAMRGPAVCGAARAHLRAPPAPRAARARRSWSDSGSAKWHMLQAWRATFVAQFGREPRVWLDKACIEQDDIDANLMCLPVFLASCSTLLVVFSPTYLERLWCVTEIFVFLQMGGTRDQIELLLSDQPERAEGASTRGAAAERDEPLPPLDVRRAIESFDVRRASCFRLDERERLLTVIEVGFGGLGIFNEVLSQLLAGALRQREGDVQLDAGRKSKLSSGSTAIKRGVSSSSL